MREIKFRAWDKVSERFITFGNGFTDKEGDWLNPTHRSNGLKTFTLEAIHYHNVGFDLEWIQFTGLKDKNGVEIYEGDIVKSKQRGAMESMTVCWNEEDAKFSFVDGGDDWYYVTEGCEIIGNIYENKELL